MVYFLDHGYWFVGPKPASFTFELAFFDVGTCSSRSFLSNFYWLSMNSYCFFLYSVFIDGLVYFPILKNDTWDKFSFIVDSWKIFVFLFFFQCVYILNLLFIRFSQSSVKIFWKLKFFEKSLWWKKSINEGKEYYRNEIGLEFMKRFPVIGTWLFLPKFFFYYFLVNWKYKEKGLKRISSYSLKGWFQEFVEIKEYFLFRFYRLFALNLLTIVLKPFFMFFNLLLFSFTNYGDLKSCRENTKIVELFTAKKWDLLSLHAHVHVRKNPFLLCATLFFCALKKRPANRGTVLADFREKSMSHIPPHDSSLKLFKLRVRTAKKRSLYKLLSIRIKAKLLFIDPRKSGPHRFPDFNRK